MTHLTSKVQEIDPEPTDEELMAAFAGGEGSAFDALFARHGPVVLTFLVQQTGSRALAEDLFQEVFLRLVRHRVAYRPTGSFRAWLFTIARNVTTDARRTGRLGRERDAIEQDLMDLRCAREPEPSARGEARELGQRIADALRRLPREQREVFLLRERAGLDFARIAELTGERLATVKSRMRYALENLRRRLPAELAEGMRE